MIVEFIGCSGSGKTTLANETTRALRADGVVVRSVTSESSSVASARNALMTPMLLTELLSRRDDNQVYWRNVVRVIQMRRVSPFWTFARMTAATRITGAHARRTYDAANRESVCLVDEGIFTTLSLASDEGSQNALDRAARLCESIPLPDVMVLVEAPVETLVERTLVRPDPPRELRRATRDLLLERFSAVSRVFSLLSGTPRISSRLISVSNPDSSESERRRKASEIARSLSSRYDECRNTIS